MEKRLKSTPIVGTGDSCRTIATGTNYRVMEDGVSGYLVKAEDKWVSALSKLIQ